MDEKRNNVSSGCNPFFSIYRTVLGVLDKTNNSYKINILSPVTRMYIFRYCVLVTGYHLYRDKCKLNRNKEKKER